MRNVIILSVHMPDEDDPLWVVSTERSRCLAYGSGDTLIEALRDFLDSVEDREEILDGTENAEPVEALLFWDIGEEI